jgi:Microtubule-binding protein MIP-T3.
MIQSKITQDEESTVTQHLIRPGNLGMLKRSSSSSGDQDSTHSAMVTIQTTEYNTHAISESIQNIAKFVSPIVRLVEHFPEHTEKISLEHHRWLEQYQVLYHDFVAAKKRTKEALYPLETEISYIDNEILRFQQLITQATIQIRQNDKWIRCRRCNKPTA